MKTLSGASAQMRSILMILAVVMGGLAGRDVHAQATGPATRDATPAAPLPDAKITDAADFGFSPDASGRDNTKALQAALDKGGTVVVSHPGIYKTAGTDFIGSNTTLRFADGVFLKKVPEDGPFTHVLLNKGALTKAYDQHITVDGLQIIVNHVDVRKYYVYGLHGQLAFFYARDIHIKHYRCLDGGPAQYSIQVCTFEDLLVEDCLIKGLKDGVHLGRGKRFVIRDCEFETGDDAVALNGHDYAVGNPELGWIENGLVTDCHDLAGDDKNSKPAGFFCRMLAGAWADWHAGMQVQQSDSIVANGRIYRVQEKPDGTIYKSITCPSFENGSGDVDGIHWGVVQADTTHTAGLRNVTFRNITLAKPRTSFSIHFDNDKFSRSYYPGAPIPRQENIVFDKIQVLYDQKVDFLSFGTPVDAVTISNSTIRNNRINFHGNKAVADFGITRLNIFGCTFSNPGPIDLITSNIPGKVIQLKTWDNTQTSSDFLARIVPGGSSIVVDSDLNGLRK